MKAIVRDEYGTPDVLRLEKIETPTPADDEVLVEVVAASINTADADQMRGYPRVARLGSGVRRPRSRYLGLDMAGRVERVGRKASRFQPGDAVWADLFGSGSGAFAEYVCAREGALHPKPVGLTFEQAATLPHSGLLALQSLDAKGPVRPGERVLINGAGGCVGPFAIQLARAFGAEVTAVDHTEKLDLLVSLGADHVIDFTREDFTKSGRRYDLILDIAAMGSVFAYRPSLEPGGRYVLVARNLAGFFSAALFGALISMGGTKEMGVFKWAPNKREDLDYLAKAVTDGNVDPVVDRNYDLAEVPDGIRYLQAGRARGKLVVTP